MVDAGEVISVVDADICSSFGSVFSLIIWTEEKKRRENGDCGGVDHDHVSMKNE